MKSVKINSACLLIVFFAISTSFAQVGIGTAAPNSSAMLDVDVSGLAANAKKGFLPPRMDETARGLITTPAAGLVIYNTTTNQLNYYNGSAWQILGTAAGSFVDLTTNQTVAGNKTFSGTLTPTGRLILPMGELSYFSTGGTTISLPNLSDGSSNMVAVDPATTLTSDFHEFDSPGSGILRYTGLTPKMFHIAVTISGTPANANNVFVFGVAKSGSIITSGKVLGSSAGTQFSSLHIMLMLSTNQTLQLFMGNTTSSNKDFIVKSLNFFAMGM